MDDPLGVQNNWISLYNRALEYSYEWGQISEIKKVKLDGIGTGDKHLHYVNIIYEK